MTLWFFPRYCLFLFQYLSLILSPCQTQNTAKQYAILSKLCSQASVNSETGLNLSKLTAWIRGAFFSWEEEGKQLTLERQTAPKGIWTTKLNLRNPRIKKRGSSHYIPESELCLLSSCFWEVSSNRFSIHSQQPYPLLSYFISHISPSFLSNYSIVTLLHFSSEQHVHLYHLHLTFIALELLTSFSSSQNKTYFRKVVDLNSFATRDFLWRTCFAVC